MRVHPGRPRESDRSWTRAAVRVHVLDLPARASAKMMITTEAVKNAIRERSDSRGRPGVYPHPLTSRLT